jgi:hypothetical protein
MLKIWTKGRLGNVLFELATGYAYALDHDLPLTISDTTKDPVMQPLYFQHLVNPVYNEAVPSKWIREMQHNYQPLPWQEEWRGYNIQLMGFWQSEKYFGHRREEVLKLFEGEIKYNEALKYSTGLHIRRGDYLTIPGKHILNSDGHFLPAAIEYINPQDVAVFSDDMDWCQNELPNKYPSINFRFVGGGTPLEDLGNLSSCENFINSSSTYSWWGAWLNTKSE